MWIPGVGAVYELPKKGRWVSDAELLQLISAEVSIPSGQRGVEAREYMRLAVGRCLCCVVWCAILFVVDGWWR